MGSLAAVVQDWICAETGVEEERPRSSAVSARLWSRGYADAAETLLEYLGRRDPSLPALFHTLADLRRALELPEGPWEAAWTQGGRAFLTRARAFALGLWALEVGVWNRDGGDVLDTCPGCCTPVLEGTLLVRVWPAARARLGAVVLGRRVRVWHLTCHLRKA
jgi:hypothetical protein